MHGRGCIATLARFTKKRKENPEQKISCWCPVSSGLCKHYQKHEKRRGESGLGTEFPARGRKGERNKTSHFCMGVRDSGLQTQISTGGQYASAILHCRRRPTHTREHSVAVSFLPKSTTTHTHAFVRSSYCTKHSMCYFIASGGMQGVARTRGDGLQHLISCF